MRSLPFQVVASRKLNKIALEEAVHIVIISKQALNSLSQLRYLLAPASRLTAWVATVPTYSSKLGTWVATPLGTSNSTLCSGTHLPRWVQFEVSWAVFPVYLLDRAESSQSQVLSQAGVISGASANTYRIGFFPISISYYYNFFIFRQSHPLTLNPALKVQHQKLPKKRRAIFIKPQHNG